MNNIVLNLNKLTKIKIMMTLNLNYDILFSLNNNKIFIGYLIKISFSFT